jgi:hypothetical protein
VWGRGGVMEWNDKEVGGFIPNNNIARTYVIKKKYRITSFLIIMIYYFDIKKMNSLRGMRSAEEEKKS